MRRIPQWGKDALWLIWVLLGMVFIMYAVYGIMLAVLPEEWIEAIRDALNRVYPVWGFGEGGE
jgi:hypothetical protein